MKRSEQLSTHGYTTTVIEGRSAILKYQETLLELGACLNQPWAMADIDYFMSKPGAFEKISAKLNSNRGQSSVLKRTGWFLLGLGIVSRAPILLLVSATPRNKFCESTSDHPVGALLLFEYRVLGLGIRIFATNDRSGRCTLIARTQLASQVLRSCIHKLQSRGARLILISCFDYGSDSKSSVQQVEDKSMRGIIRQRRTLAYLVIGKTMDETLAKIGPRTRRNLRHYRRAAESQLGCVFVPEVTISHREFVLFNRESMYAVADGVATWRYNSLSSIASPFLAGLKDAYGQWLCLVGGRRRGTDTEVLWQVNRDGLRSLSLSTVMRSYLIEHEVSRGTKRLFMEGGTANPLGHSFISVEIIDLFFIRRSLVALWMRKFAKRLVQEGDELGGMLLKDDQ